MVLIILSFRSRPGLKLKTNDVGRSEPVIRPRDRIVLIREQVETTLERQKAIDHHWEDLVDVSNSVGYLLSTFTGLLQNPYQPPIVPYPSKLFKFVAPPESPVWPTSIGDKTSPPLTSRRPRAVRMRYGRGGRVFLDRRDPTPQRLTKRLPRSSLFTHEEDETTLNEGAEEVESQKTLEERWNFDTDDLPPVGPDGAEEHDRHLIDDYDAGWVYIFGTLIFERG
jgi:enhancer of polycomb-like protein